MERIKYDITEPEKRSIYVLIAIDDGKVKECIVVQDSIIAQGIRKRLIEIYGGANVCLTSRAIDDVPIILWANST